MAQAIDDNLHMSGGDIDGLIVVGELPLVSCVDPTNLDLRSLKIEHLSSLKSLHQRDFDDCLAIKMCKSGGMQLNLISNLSKENLKSLF